MAVGFIDMQSKYAITVLGNEIFMMCGSAYSCGGGVGQLTGIEPNYAHDSGDESHDHSVLDLKVNLVNMTGINTESMGAFFGGFKPTAHGVLKITSNAEIKKEAYVNHLIINGGKYAGILGSVFFEPRAEPEVMIIRNIQMDLNATDANAPGVAHALSASKPPIVLLLSGHGTLASPHHLLYPGDSCPESLIDWSGIHFNTHHVGCAHATLVESITPSGWRMAHHRLAQHICTDDPHACHYVNEVPLALVKGEDHAFFLVSQQTHPYNHTITGKGPIRVTQWNGKDFNAPPRINTHFAVNGTQLYSANAQAFPASSPLSVSVDGEHLLMLFDENGIQLVALALTLSQETSSYHMQALEGLEGHPVQLAGKNLWIQKENQLQRVTVFPHLKSPSLVLPLGINHTVVGVTKTENYIYVACTMNIEGTHATHALRFRTDGLLDNTWQATLSEHNDYRYRQLDVRGDPNNPDIHLPLVVEMIHKERFDDQTKILSVVLPPRGGYADWRSEEAQQSTRTLLTASTEKKSTPLQRHQKTRQTSESTAKSTAESTTKSTEGENTHSGTLSSDKRIFYYGFLTPLLSVGVVIAVVVIVWTCYSQHKFSLMMLQRQTIPRASSMDSQIAEGIAEIME